jgi:hypothetical protein
VNQQVCGIKCFDALGTSVPPWGQLCGRRGNRVRASGNWIACL